MARRSHELEFGVASLDDSSGGDRAFSDVAFAIAFSMMVIVYVLVPYVIAMTGVAVQVPMVSEEIPAESQALPTDLVIELRVLAAGGGSRLMWSRAGEDPVPSSAADLLGDIAAALPELAERDVPVVFQVLGERQVSYEDVMEVVNRLPNLPGAASVEIELRSKLTN